MYKFAYSRPGSVEEAAGLLSADGEARLLSGGMSLVPVLRHRLAAPARLIDLNRIPDLRKIEAEPGLVRIGAAATHYAVSVSPLVRAHIPALAGLAGGIGDPLVRNRGTIGGSLANNDPAACYPSALLGLGGTVYTNRRAIPPDTFILGTFQTALEPGELIVQVEFPVPDVAAHVKFENFASRFSIVGVFVSRTGSRVRVGVTGAAACAFRAIPLEAELERDFTPEAVEGILIPEDTLNPDIHASASFRSQLITELTARAVAQCLQTKSFTPG